VQNYATESFPFSSFFSCSIRLVRREDNQRNETGKKTKPARTNKPELETFARKFKSKEEFKNYLRELKLENTIIFKKHE
jgi:hypothetical protein